MWAKLPESETYLAAVEAPRQRGAPVARGAATSCAAATCASASACGWPRSWACCWSTASTPGCRRSWARPATPSRPAPRCCWCSTSARSIGLLVAGRISDARGNKPTVLLWFGLAAAFLALLSDQAGERRSLVYVARAARRHLRVQRPGARLRLRRPPLPAGDPRHRPRHGRRGRPGRRHRRPVARRRAGHRRDRLPVGLLRLRDRAPCSRSSRLRAPCPHRCRTAFPASGRLQPGWPATARPPAPRSPAGRWRCSAPSTRSTAASR